MSVVVAHLSDIHVSRFGEHVTNVRNRKLRTPFAKSKGDWEEVSKVDGWRVEQRARGWRERDPEKGFELRLCDDRGYVQERRRAPKGEEGAARKALEQLAVRRRKTEHARLALSFPRAEDVESLLETDAHNTNLLFHRAARALREDKPDWVLISGDLTDDGVGYDLVMSWLAPWVEKRRLLAVPGNHDTYDSPALMVPAPERKTRAQKRVLWCAFAIEIGVPTACPWVRELGEGAVLAGLDSCIPPRTPWSASGAIDADDLLALEADLDALPEDTCRIGMLHHHVVNPPIHGIGRAPWQIGMHLRNAEEMFDFFRRRQFACVLNGRRHVGYRFQPANAPLYVSAPSATMGCRSGVGTFYWRLELEARQITSVRERPFP